MEIQTEQSFPWQIQPYQGESISHYLGRVRRADAVSASSASGLSKALGLGIALARWEKFRFNPYPSRVELEALDELVRLGVDRLIELFPPEDEPIRLQPIRFCPACYVESGASQLCENS